MTKQKVVCKLRSVLSQAFELKYKGADGIKHARLQGLADGYMAALTDLDIMDQRELLEVVNDERRRAACETDDRCSHPPVPLTAPNFI